MRITKFPQSCLKIEKSGGIILVDPGSVTTATYKVKDFGRFDAVLYTHSHYDHLDKGIVDELLETGAILYGNQNIADVLQGKKVEVIQDGEELVIAGFKVEARHMEHCPMVNGEPAGIPNTGFLIDGELLLPGDSTEDAGWQARVVALPIFGPDISFRDAYDLTRSTQAKMVVPVHFDVVDMNPNAFKQFYQMMTDGQVEVRIVENAVSTDISS